jgi:hypothetical protein
VTLSYIFYLLLLLCGFWILSASIILLSKFIILHGLWMAHVVELIDIMVPMAKIDRINWLHIHKNI